MLKMLEEVQAADVRAGKSGGPVVYDLACECDRLRAHVAEVSAYLGRKCTEFAAKAERGEPLYGSSPLQTSSVFELVSDVGALKVADANFMVAYRAAYGAEETRALKSRLESHVVASLDIGERPVRS